MTRTASQTLEGLFSAALQQHQAGRLHEAGRRYRQILAANPHHADSLHMLGMVEHQMGRLDSATDQISKAITLNDRIAPYHFNLGRVLEDAARLEEAVRCYGNAIHLSPNNADFHANLGNVLGELGRLEEAAACFRKALALEPGFPEAHTNLGNTLRDLGQCNEAVVHGRRAIELAPNFSEAYLNLGVMLSHQGRLNEAIACYRRALDLQPDLPAGHTNLGMVLLAQGHMERGWDEYEWRWKTRQMSPERRNFVQPQWQGEAGNGRTLLIHAEQGFGDTMQFCRYAALAASRGLRVLLEVQKPLVRLLKDLPGVDQVIGHGEALPSFDLHAPMLSLPRALGTTVETIPGATPYLHADPAAAADWRMRLGAIDRQGPRIGLVWAGSSRKHSPVMAAIDRRRSMPPEFLAPLFEVPGLQFFSLQKDGPVAPVAFQLIDQMAEIGDFADTAALVANLDLVISVDTAVAHLAAALGKPVWIMNRFDSCWRWLVGRRDSPWYPTLRLYHQPQPGDWYSVVAEIARDLHSLSADGIKRRSDAAAPG